MMRQRWSIVLGVSLWLMGTSVQAVSFNLDAIPAGPITSGNGLLEFSNFQFFSAFGTVDGGDITLTTLDDGIEIKGPVTASGADLKSFSVLYEVKALGPGIDGASLLLDSDVDAEHLAFVLSTKKILSTGPPKTSEWWKPGKGHGSDLFPLLGNSLARLKTADWEIHGGHEDCDHPAFSRDGAIRLVEAGFPAQGTIRVVDEVVIGALDGTATWQSSVNRFTVVPEPGVAALTLLGLVALGWRGRRRSV